MSAARRIRREQERRSKKMNPTNGQPTPEQLAALKKAMEEEHRMVFTRAELIVIFNVFTNVTVKYGDFVQMKSIIDKIGPIVAVDSNIPGSNQPSAPVDGEIINAGRRES